MQEIKTEAEYERSILEDLDDRLRASNYDTSVIETHVWTGEWLAAYVHVVGVSGKFTQLDELDDLLSPRYLIVGRRDDSRQVESWRSGKGEDDIQVFYPVYYVTYKVKTKKLKKETKKMVKKKKDSGGDITPLQLTRAQAVFLFVALKFKTADKWSNERLEEKFKILPNSVNPERRPDGVEANKLLDRVLEHNGVVEIKDEDSGSGAKPAEKKTKAKPTPKKDGVKRDEFGNKEGTQSAAINVLITKKTPIDLNTIVEKTGYVKGRVGSHLHTLKTKGFITKVEKGYVRT